VFGLAHFPGQESHNRAVLMLYAHKRIGPRDGNPSGLAFFSTDSVLLIFPAYIASLSGIMSRFATCVNQRMSDLNGVAPVVPGHTRVKGFTETHSRVLRRL
jgi:hypothetical protein